MHRAKKKIEYHNSTKVNLCPTIMHNLWCCSNIQLRFLKPKTVSING